MAVLQLFFLLFCYLLVVYFPMNCYSLRINDKGQVLYKEQPIVTANISVSWDGSQGCSICTFGGYYTENFACSSSNWEWDSGNWNNGTKTFKDPTMDQLPPDFILTQVSVNIWGVFDCRTTDFAPTSMKIYLQDTFVAEQIWTEQRLCICANCQEMITLTSHQVDEWPNFNYKGLNEVKVVVEENLVCISTMELILTYSKRPDVALIRPLVEHQEGPYLTKNVVVLSSIAGGLAFLICASMIVLAIVRKYRPDEDSIAYQRVPVEYPEDIALTESTKQLQERFRSLFRISGSEIVLGPVIGKGSYGEVYRADWRGILVAVKKLPASLLEDKKLLRDFYQEATIMSSLRHPNIVQYLGTCVIGTDLCIISEYMSCGSVHKLLHNENFDLTWDLIKKFALDTAQGMLYLHESSPKVLHRDLKSQNLLCDQSFKVKISDFGLSKVIENVNADMTSCGTASWAAPEVLKNSRYTEKADVYSFGVCLWEFVARRDPYEGMPAFQVIFAVGNEGLRPTIPRDCPLDYAALIQECWNVNPEDRPTFRDLVHRIKSLF